MANVNVVPQMADLMVNLITISNFVALLKLQGGGSGLRLNKNSDIKKEEVNVVVSRLMLLCSVGPTGLIKFWNSVAPASQCWSFCRVLI